MLRIHLFTIKISNCINFCKKKHYVKYIGKDWKTKTFFLMNHNSCALTKCTETWAWVNSQKNRALNKFSILRNFLTLSIENLIV